MISSLQNPQVKAAKKLWDRRHRDESGYFLIEGYRELLRSQMGNVFVELLFVCPELFLGSMEGTLIEEMRKKGTEILVCDEKVYRSLSYRDRPDGLLGVAEQRHLLLSELKSAENALFVVAEAIEKPGNLGTILRSADAVSANGVIVCDRCTDVHNPNVVRASVGTLFTLPVAEASGEAVIAWLQKNRIASIATTPSATKEYTDVDLKGPIAIIVGTEQYGLSAKWMEAADHQVKIPMNGVADSLNVAMATTLLLYEAARQRKMR